MFLNVFWHFSMPKIPFYIFTWVSNLILLYHIIQILSDKKLEGDVPWYCLIYGCRPFWMIVYTELIIVLWHRLESQQSYVLGVSFSYKKSSAWYHIDSYLFIYLFNNKFPLGIGSSSKVRLEQSISIKSCKKHAQKTNCWQSDSYWVPLLLLSFYWLQQKENKTKHRTKNKHPPPLPFHTRSDTHT